VRYASERGLITADSAAQSEILTAPFWSRWFRPALAAAAVSAVILAALLIWLLLYQVPHLRNELAQERLQHQQSEQENKQKLEQILEQLNFEREARVQLEKQLAPDLRTEANVPLVILSATRATEPEANKLTMSAGARSLVLWLDVDEAAPYSSYRLQIYRAKTELLQTVEGLKKNDYGALAISLPAEPFQTGNYTVKLYGIIRQQSVLIGEYRLQIIRR